MPSPLKLATVTDCDAFTTIVSFMTNFTSPILADDEFGIAAGVRVAVRLTVMLTLLGLVCLETNSVILPDGYPVKTAKRLATLDVLLG